MLPAAGPESESEQVNDAVTFVLFQPLAFAAGKREPLIVGGVLSIFTPVCVFVAVLPALSVQVPIADWLGPSDESVWLAFAANTPDRLSAQLQFSATSELFHPLAFAAVRLTKVMIGTPRSILMPPAVAEEVLPALSVQVPETDCPAPSALSVTGVVHESIPDKLSVALAVTDTLVLFHPLAFGPGDATAVVTGGVLSMPIPVTVAVAELPARSVQDPLAD